MFKLELTRNATKFLDKCDNELCQRLLTRMESLATDPFPKDVKRVKGRKERIFRVRVGDYRIQYCIFFENNNILIMDIDKRSKAYQ